MAIIGAGKIKYFRFERQKQSSRTKRRKPVDSAYQRRNKCLSLLGFSSYAEYLKSELWQQIRRVKLDKFPLCLICEQGATCVHHIDYDFKTLSGKSMKSLVTLCNACHLAIEFVDGKKQRLHEANKLLYRMARNAGKKQWIQMYKNYWKPTKQQKRRKKTHNKK